MLALGALVMGIAIGLNSQILREAGPSTTSTVMYLTPLFAIVACLAFLKEQVGRHEVIGGLLVVLGVALAQAQLLAAARAVATRLRLAPDMTPA